MWTGGTLEELCEIEYGTRVVRKNEEGTIYPVYGGGGETFRVDRKNRSNRVVVSRFGMSEQCTRFVEGDFFLNDSGLTVSSKVDGLSQSYLDRVIFSLNKQIFALGRGAAQKNLDMNGFKRLEFSYPPLAEQQRIVAKLDAAFAEIEKLEHSSECTIERVKNLRQKQLIRAFHELNIFYDKRTLGAVCKSMHQGLNTQAEKIVLVDDGIPLLQTRNVQSESLTLNGQLNYLPAELWQKYRTKYAPKTGDVFFTNRGTIGKTAICNDDMDAVVHWNIFKLTPDETVMTPKFLLFSLQYLRESGYFYDLQKGTTVSFVSTKMMKEASVPCPDIETQKNVCKMLAALELQFASLELLLEKKARATLNLKSAILAQELQPPQSEAA